MRIHGAPGRPWIMFDVGIGIELGEQLVERPHPRCEDERLIAVVTGAPVALAKRARHGQLGDFFAVAENPEFGLAGEDLFASDQAGLPAAEGDAIVLDDALASELRAELLRLLGRRHFFMNRSMGSHLQFAVTKIVTANCRCDPTNPALAPPWPASSARARRRGSRSRC